jgi:hypothetical protein
MDHSTTYNAAVALNNMGIALLERGCYRQALATLHDAVRLTCQESTSTSSACTMTTNLNKASRRQCGPEPSKITSPLHLEVVSDDSASVTCIHATHRPDSAIVIRLEGFDSTIDVAVDIAVILHNYAMAALCLSLAHPKSKSSKHLLQTCLKNLLQCQKELASRYELLDVDMDFPLVQKVFVVAVISTNSLLQTFGHLGADQCELQMDECQAKLETLKETLADLDHSELSVGAAAAA